ncbi:MAG: Mur ligase domain-containing protein, partial [Chitinophagaceae bacterium]|nr:Mur ligase domain-containing protein [Chitinophagaceae bacterium]
MLQSLYQKYLEVEQQVCTDTRKIIPNSMFFALKGTNFDGNQFALNALENGCKYAVVDDETVAKKNTNCILVDNVLKTLQQLARYHRLQLNVPVIGVT